jgi:hypothetical protein
VAVLERSIGEAAMAALERGNAEERGEGAVLPLPSVSSVLSHVRLPLCLLVRRDVGVD